MADLPDVNIWLALAWDGHAGHPAARAWWDSSAQPPLCFCRISQMALLRLLTNASVLGKDSKSQAEAWAIYDALRNSPRVEFLDEPSEFEESWRTLSSRTVPAAKRWTDDYLAAFALAHALRVVTFDEGFESYAQLPVTLLTMPAQPVPPAS